MEARANIHLDKLDPIIIILNAENDRSDGVRARAIECTRDSFRRHLDNCCCLKVSPVYEALESKFRTYDYSTTNTVAESALPQNINIYVNIEQRDREKRMITGILREKKRGKNQNWFFMFGCCVVKREIQNVKRKKTECPNMFHTRSIGQVNICGQYAYAKSKENKI